MIGWAELPVGARFKVEINGEMASVVVTAGLSCRDCVCDGGDALCHFLECREEARTDGTAVAFKKEEGGKE